jgi:hypothetical protein
MLIVRADINLIAQDIITEHIKSGKGIGLNFLFLPFDSDGVKNKLSDLRPAICINNRHDLFPNRKSKRKDSSTLDLTYMMSRQLHDGNTNNARYVLTYIRDYYAASINRPDLPLIREYIIPIDYPGIWESKVRKIFGDDWYLKNHKTNDSELSGFIYRSFISLDIYSPIQKIAIEADSSAFHLSDKLQILKDKVRDEYLDEVYGIKTVRVVDFNPSISCNKLKDDLNKYKLLEKPYFPKPNPERLEQAILRLGENCNIHQIIGNCIRLRAELANRLRSDADTTTKSLLNGSLYSYSYLKEPGMNGLFPSEKTQREYNYLHTIKSIINTSIFYLEHFISEDDIKKIIGIQKP